MPDGRRSGPNGRLILVAVLVVLALVFILQNRQSVKISFLMIDFSSPLWLMMALFVVIGFLLGIVFVRSRRPRRPARVQPPPRDDVSPY